MSDPSLDARAAEVEALLAQVELIEDPAARDAALAAVQGIVELYGAALARIVAAASDVGGPGLLDRFTADPLVGHLLMLHELHPDAVEARVGAALDEVRPYIRSHGGDVELLAVDGGIARVRLTGSCKGCPSSAVTLHSSVEEAVLRAAPELTGIEAENGASAPAPPAAPMLVQLGNGR
ncbi:MAG: NifU family protein [Gemmatimonadales bacterium]|nr:NifU family protein [Gemmatimonadales bacterium]